MIDGASALASAVGSVFGDLALVQRCQIHKRRNVKDHLPKASRGCGRPAARNVRGPRSRRRVAQGQGLAAELERTHPDAAGSLREGPRDMFTVRRLGIDGTLARTLVCTNMISR